mmetsp:Transcript_21107/g.26089  ORF Transcript_21107/g.26089 Transcript_21107/m.26089 type:complete len:661 (-) Transcript_21107:170-2152(-)|eukprot:CAMPEP_0172496352 /NCGR_PEP_ID=MMETSP1066-20121228/85837_1 /TAXON_ID=671091 /ORGANISM="Coscinodiscus wailesii, Strain CCMP2513" /LENGTH=660 /DNA_ID=CAMNT_0013268613 /DNA_START=186 /DNA_END=2168 /DNA_ORIENTATION=-
MRVVLSLGQKNSNQQQQQQQQPTPNPGPQSSSSQHNSQGPLSSSGATSSGGSFEGFQGEPGTPGSCLAVESNASAQPGNYRKRDKTPKEERSTPITELSASGKTEDQNQRSNSSLSYPSPLLTSSSSATVGLPPPKKPSFAGSQANPSVKNSQKSRHKSAADASTKEKAKKRSKPNSSDIKPQSLINRRESGSQKKHKFSTSTSSTGTCVGTPARLKSDEPRVKKASKMTRGKQHWDDNYGRPLYGDDSRDNRDDPIEVRNASRCYDDIDPAGFENAGVSDFMEKLKKKGLEMIEMEGDGNCLFRAVSYQVYGDDKMHTEIRKRCLDFMAKDEAHFSQFVTGESFRDYIRRKRFDGVHGNNPEIQAISELFNRPVEVFVPNNGASPINIFHSEYKTSDAPIRLSYHDGNHYNAVIDPLCPTAGLGLGLPGLEPGLADKMQMKEACEESDKMADKIEIQKAIKESQNYELQRVMLESEKFSVDNLYKQKKEALALSDLEATDFELEQAILTSSLESYNNIEQTQKQPWSRETSRSNRRIKESRHTRSNSPPGPGVFPRNIRSNSPPTSYTRSSQQRSMSPLCSSVANVAASSCSVASAAASSASANNDSQSLPANAPQDEYPPVVQELVMNGFELPRVVHAYDLIGDNFDDLLTFLMNSAS